MASNPDKAESFFLYVQKRMEDGVLHWIVRLTRQKEVAFTWRRPVGDEETLSFPQLLSITSMLLASEVPKRAAEEFVELAGQVKIADADWAPD